MVLCQVMHRKRRSVQVFSDAVTPFVEGEMNSWLLYSCTRVRGSHHLQMVYGVACSSTWWANSSSMPYSTTSMSTPSLDATEGQLAETLWRSSFSLSSTPPASVPFCHCHKISQVIGEKEFVFSHRTGHRPSLWQDLGRSLKQPDASTVKSRENARTPTRPVCLPGFLCFFTQFRTQTLLWVLVSSR